MRSVCLCLFALSISGVSQTITPSFTSTATSPNLSGVSMSSVDNIPNCLATTSYNQFGCWHYSALNLGSATTPSGKARSIASSSAYTFMLSQNGIIWAFSGWSAVGGPNWTELGYWQSGWQDLAIDGTRTVWALGAPAAYVASPPPPCPSGSWGIYQQKLNGPWYQYYWIEPNTSQCASKLSIASDGTMLIVSPGGGIAKSTNTGASWSALSTVGTGWTKISVANSTYAVGVKTDNTVWAINLTSDSTAKIPGVSAIDASVDSANSGKIYALSTSGNIWVYSSAVGYWQQLLGSGFTALSNGGPMNVWAIGNISGVLVPNNTTYTGNIWVLADHALNATTNMKGTATCSGNCSAVTTHVLGQFWWGGPSVSSYAQGTNGTPNFFLTNNQSYSIPVNVSPSYQMYDPFLCMDPATSGSNCQIYELDQLMCNGCAPPPPPGFCQQVWLAASIAASAGAPSGGNGVSFKVNMEAAFTRADWKGAPPPSCTPDRACTYPTVNNCTPASTPPDLNVIAVESGDFRGTATYLSWMNAAACIRFVVNGHNYPWICSKPFSQLNGLNGTPFPPFACTHNP